MVDAKSLINDLEIVNSLRILSVDMIENAKSGHPGMPLGCSPILYILFKNHLNFNPSETDWINRDRFVLSNGHGCALLYSILHLFGYNLSLDDLKKFRKLGSITPGHPEKDITPGIEVTTGPLGQGIANGVGMAIASKHLGARFNIPDFEVFDNKIYVMCGDGCLMEGVSNEAVSLAGHLKLDNLILLYDDNEISIDGSTDLSFTENTKNKFEALGWKVFTVDSADIDLVNIDETISEAKKSDKPVLIRMKTKIGYGSDKEGSEKSHGAPLGIESVKKLKNKLNFDEDKSFFISDEIKEFINEILSLKKVKFDNWTTKFEEYKNNSEKYDILKKIISKEIIDINQVINKYNNKDKPMATRQSSGAILKELMTYLPQLVGGSADLSPSNNTKIDDGLQKTDFSKRYIHFGVREHAMAAIANGLSTYGIIPFVGTFLVFINYCLASIRLSALSKHQVLYILTHDSVGLGEDGPTHQPVESLSILRSIPNSLTFRPADGNETIGSYSVALSEKNKPSCICLSRQNLPHLENSSSLKVEKGAYTIFENSDNFDLILIATGSEVSLCIDVASELKGKINIRVVSMPCSELYDLQDQKYKEELLPKNVKKLSVEAGVTLMWYKYADFCYGIDCYGESGKGNEVMNYFGFSKEKIIEYINSIIN